MAPPHVLLNAFEMNAVGHLAHGVWSHPEDRATGYRRIGYWMELARILERAQLFSPGRWQAADRREAEHTISSG